MAEYTVLKPLNLRGKKRVTGEVVNDTVIDLKRVWSLKRSGYIAEIGNRVPPGEPEESVCAFTGSPEDMLLTIPILCEEGVRELVTKPVSVISAVKIIQMDAKEAIAELGNLDDGDALLIIHALDSRKTVKEASEFKAKKLEKDTERERLESKGFEDPRDRVDETGMVMHHG